MTQITATLNSDANPSIIRQVLENMKGVIRVSINKEDQFPASKKSDIEGWLSELQALQDNINLSAIDIKDERTRHILRGSNLLDELRADQK